MVSLSGYLEEWSDLVVTEGAGRLVGKEMGKSQLKAAKERREKLEGEAPEEDQMDNEGLVAQGDGEADRIERSWQWQRRSILLPER